MHIQQVEGVLVVALDGELDHHRVELLRTEVDRAIDAAKVSAVVFDLKDVNFMDSSGLGLILGRFRRLSERRVSMALAAPQPTVARLLQMSGIRQIMPVCSTLAEAITQVKEVSHA